MLVTVKQILEKLIGGRIGRKQPRIRWQNINEKIEHKTVVEIRNYVEIGMNNSNG